VHKAGHRVRITAQLVDALSGAHLWADRFDGSLTHHNLIGRVWFVRDSSLEGEGFRRHIGLGYRGMSELPAHRHYDTFELPEAPDRLLPERLAISFSTDREGNIASLAAPFEPLVKDIVFTRIAAGDCTNPTFRQDCTGTFSQGVTTVVVAQDNDGQLTLTFGSQPTYKLRPYQSRTFVIDELEGFRVEFHLDPDGEVDELFFHQPNGTFVARRA
jgi:hypothetical protein